MNHMLKYSLACLLLVLALASCRKEPNYPDEPEISFKRIEKQSYVINGVNTDSLTFVIGYQDGDGNLGLSTTIPEDGQPPFNEGSPYYYNFVLKFYEQVVKSDGTLGFEPFRGGFTLAQRFPRISSDDRKEPLEGEIKFKYEITEDLLEPNTVLRFEAYIYDRTTPVPNKSNVVVSEPITMFPR